MSKTARLEIILHRNRWKIKTPFGDSWTSHEFHGADHLKPVAVNHFNTNNRGRYDDYVVLVESPTGWF